MVMVSETIEKATSIVNRQLQLSHLYENIKSYDSHLLFLAISITGFIIYLLCLNLTFLASYNIQEFSFQPKPN